jgi:hypothetical protein
MNQTVQLVKAIEVLIWAVAPSWEGDAKLQARFIANNLITGRDIRPLVEGVGLPHILRDAICSLSL